MRKNFKKILKMLIIISTIICISLFFNLKKSNADAGSHASHSSSHSSSRSSSSSSSRRSSSSSSGSGDVSAVGAALGFSMVLLFIIITIASCKKPKDAKLINNANAINEIKKNVPNFNEKEFLDNGYKIFLDIEKAWMNFELEKVRNTITDEMYTMYESQLASMEIKGEQNIMKDFVLKDCAITSAVKQNDNIEVKTKYVVEFYDYIVDKETQKLVRGFDTRKIRMYYEFTFIMNDSQKKVENCPNCGSKVNINSAGVCDYCGSKIIGTNNTWVMSKKVCYRNQTNL